MIIREFDQNGSLKAEVFLGEHAQFQDNNLYTQQNQFAIPARQPKQTTAKGRQGQGGGGDTGLRGRPSMASTRPLAAGSQTQANSGQKPHWTQTPEGRRLIAQRQQNGTWGRKSGQATA